MLKKCLAAIVLLLTLCMCAQAQETVTLEYPYGDEAFDLHMAEMPITVEYDGHVWSLDDKYAGFEGDFMLYGGKTHAVYEISVPQKQFSVQDEGNDKRIGTVVIDVPEKATLHVFEGNRMSGEYVLLESRTFTGVYEDEIYIKRDAAGHPVLVDRVYLYTYKQSGQTHYYGMTFYMEYEGYRARAAELAALAAQKPTVQPTVVTTPVPAPTVPANMGGAYHDVAVRMIEYWMMGYGITPDDYTDNSNKYHLGDSIVMNVPWDSIEDTLLLSTQDVVNDAYWKMATSALKWSSGRDKDAQRLINELKEKAHFCLAAGESTSEERRLENVTVRMNIDAEQMLCEVMFVCEDGGHVMEQIADALLMPAESKETPASTVVPTAVPTPVPTDVPTPEPTATPTVAPTAVITPEPTATPVPTRVPTSAPVVTVVTSAPKHALDLTALQGKDGFAVRSDGSWTYNHSFAAPVEENGQLQLQLNARGGEKTGEALVYLAATLYNTKTYQPIAAYGQPLAIAFFIQDETYAVELMECYTGTGMSMAYLGTNGQELLTALGGLQGRTEELQVEVVCENGNVPLSAAESAQVIEPAMHLAAAHVADNTTFDFAQYGLSDDSHVHVPQELPPFDPFYAFGDLPGFSLNYSTRMWEQAETFDIVVDGICIEITLRASGSLTGGNERVEMRCSAYNAFTGAALEGYDVVTGVEFGCGPENFVVDLLDRHDRMHASMYLDASYERLLAWLGDFAQEESPGLYAGARFDDWGVSIELSGMEGKWQQFRDRICLTASRITESHLLSYTDVDVEKMYGQEAFYLEHVTTPRPTVVGVQ